MPLDAASAASLLERHLREWLGGDVPLRSEPQAPGGPDIVLGTPDRTFIVEIRRSDNIGSLEGAARQLDSWAHEHPGATKLVIVPNMGPKAREWMARRGLGWLDLGGNAEVHAPGLHVRVQESRSARAPRAGSSPFAPRSSRVARALLMEPARPWTQRELAQRTGLAEGTVSKVASLLEARGLVVRDGRRGLRVTDASVLLDAWGQQYDFLRHDVHRFHRVGRTGLQILRATAEALESTPRIRHAATGLGAAALWTRFGDFRLSTFYVSALPSDPASLGLRPAEAGENVWLVVPRDEGVFHGMSRQGSWCVHPVQAILDCSAQPERSAEAAAALRERILGASA